ncbi:hypothetical protein D9M70_483090 [compost metagenome]
MVGRPLRLEIGRSRTDRKLHPAGPHARACRGVSGNCQTPVRRSPPTTDGLLAIRGRQLGRPGLFFAARRYISLLPHSRRPISWPPAQTRNDMGGATTWFSVCARPCLTPHRATFLDGQPLCAYLLRVAGDGAHLRGRGHASADASHDHPFGGFPDRTRMAFARLSGVCYRR